MGSHLDQSCIRDTHQLEEGSEVIPILPGNFYIGMHSGVSKDDFQVALSLSPGGLHCPLGVSHCKQEGQAGVLFSHTDGQLN